MKITNKNTPRVKKNRVFHDIETIYNVLDKNYICYIGFIQDDYPVVIPTNYGRYKNDIYIHGAPFGRKHNQIEKNSTICVTVSNVTALQFTRSAYNHSCNYESVMFFSKAEVLKSDSEKIVGLKALIEHLAKGRWNEVRKPDVNELKATGVIKIPIEEASVKVKNTEPSEHKKDLALKNIWAGTVPVSTFNHNPISSEGVEIEVSESINSILT